MRDAATGERARDEIAETVPHARLSVFRGYVSDLDDVRRFAAELGAHESAVDVLVHNAGVVPAERRTAQGHELAPATHVLGSLAMTESLRAARPSRVIWVSSGGMYAQRFPRDAEYQAGN